MTVEHYEVFVNVSLWPWQIAATPAYHDSGALET
jgi:hypothetical protein